ncbi:hypothetical protein NEIRO02_2322 [Nematocida sp. AWRm79]|nr:hypothetical protein NEIRO02_2322 [Nematocida sp. AWRm79]
MVGHIDEDELRTKLQREFKDKEGKIEQKDISKLFNIITEINRKRRIFTGISSPLDNLAYNMLYKQIYSRIRFERYTEDYIVSKMNDCIKHVDLIIDIIMNVAKELESDDQKQAFYDLMGNNHMVMAQVYKFKWNFFIPSINILCRKAGIQKLNDKITSEDAMVKLCELTSSGECSRLQNALNILMKYGDNLTIPDKNGIEQSNADKLGLTEDDIYSLQLITRTYRWNNIDLNKFLNDSIYNSIYIEDNEHSLNYSISNLYNTVFDMSKSNGISNIESYKKKNIDKIKECLNELMSKERMGINNEIRESKVYNHIKTHKHFNIEDFKNNVIQKYLKSIESGILSIIGPYGYTKKIVSGEPKNTNRIQNNGIDSKVVKSLPETLSTLAQRINEPNNQLVEANKLGNEDNKNPTETISTSTKPIHTFSTTSNRSNEKSSSQHKESPTSFWNTKNISIIAILMIISIIILSIILLYSNEAKKIVNNLNTSLF